MTHEIITSDSGIEQIVITNADGSKTTWVKELYDAAQVEHLTEIPTS